MASFMCTSVSDYAKQFTTGDLPQIKTLLVHVLRTQDPRTPLESFPLSLKIDYSLNGNPEINFSLIKIDSSEFMFSMF